MPYDDNSTAARFLDGDPEAIGTVSRWIAIVLSSPQFRALRPRSLDLHQEAVLRVLDAFRREMYDPARDLRVYSHPNVRRQGRSTPDCSPRVIREMPSAGSW
jgi:hypothetical protein